MSRANILVMMRASKLLVVLATIAIMIWVTGTANAATHDRDGDHLSNSLEKNVTHTLPRDADSDDGIKDGSEDAGEDGIDNTDDLKLSLPLGEDDADEDENDDDLDDEEDED